MKTAPNRALWSLLAASLILALNVIFGTFRSSDAPGGRQPDASAQKVESHVQPVLIEPVVAPLLNEAVTADLPNVSSSFEEVAASTTSNTKPDFSVFVSQPVTPRIVKVPVQSPAQARQAATALRMPVEVPEGVGERLPFPMKTRHAPIADPVFQRQRAAKILETDAVSAPAVNFGGLSSAANPPDTTGDVGPNHYIQMVNATTFQIWNKAGVSLVGPTTFGNLWPTPTANAGDPIVVYDGMADRWVLSQFHSTGMYFAVSQTSDPTAGTWYLYDFTTYTTLPDYPKIGVWPDGYLMTTYEAGLGLHVFDRAKMIAGQPATFMKTTVPQYSGTVRDTRILPVHLTGPTPPAGTPGYFMRTVDHQQDTANPQDRIEIYKAIINFSTSTFNVSLSDTVTPAPFNTMVANRNGGGIRDVIPQPGTTATLDALSNRPMMQLGYRQFGGVAKMVFCQTIDISGSIPALTGITPAQEVAGIRWYILQQTTPGGAWSIEQQGTFGDQPAGITAENQLIHRWMGSAAMNGNGDLAIGYSACNDDDTNPIYPGIRYTGRVVTDPVNTLPQGEGIIMNGTSSKGANGAYGQRWGDYAQMGVDPTDDSTFWFTTHVASGATRVASFTMSAPPGAEIAVSQAANGLFDGSSTRDFGTLALGGSTTLTFTISNLGLSSLSGLAVSIDGADAADFSATQPSVTTLATAGTTTFTVTFNRASYGGSSAVLHIASNDADENPFDVNLTGAVALPEIALEQPAGTVLTNGFSTTDFGLVRVGSSTPLSFRIQNVGGPTLSGLSVSVDGTHASDFIVTQPAQTSLAAGVTTSFSVSFAPTANGVRSAVLHVASNDADDPSFDINLTGEGFLPDVAVEQPDGTGLVDGTSIVSYGNVLAGSNLTKRFAIRNAGAGTLNLGSVSIDGLNSADFVLGPISLTRTTLVPGQTAFFEASFRPTLINSKSAVLHITSDDPDEPVFDINLTGFATTPGGPVQLARDINIAANGFSPTQTIVIGSQAFFIGTTTEFGSELWRTDGTTVGTQQVRDIFTGTSGASLSGLTSFNGALFFSANNSTNGQELWKSDGTLAGTVLVKDINSGFLSSTPSSLTVAGTTLYLAATDATNGTELWKSDGTTAGTVLVTNIAATTASSFPANLRAVGSTVFFTATNGTNGTELWKSDGTAGGTVMVKDIIAGATSSSPTNLTAVGSTLYFTVNDTVNGQELWKSDGTDAGTVMVKDINAGSASSSPASLTAFGGLLYFMASTAAEGSELWVSDGTGSGTVLVKDINTGTLSSTPTNLLAAGSTLYFSAFDGSGRELWKTDGTSSGTVMVKDISAGSGSSSPANLSLIGSTLYFQATDAVIGFELWKTDGTGAGTVLVKDIAPGSSSSSPSALANLGGTLLFAGSDGLNGVELWKSDGSEAGTVQVFEGQAGNISSAPSNLRHVNGTLYFSATDSGNGTELWKSDGTVAGTVLVSNIASGTISSSPANFSNIGNTLYFSATDGTNGLELWRSDGTAASTAMVKNINTGVGAGSSPAQLTAVGSILYFSATDGSIVSTELWKSDGSSLGTVLVKDINPTASAGSSLANLTDFNGTLFFSANDGTNGAELWKSDGTAAGTVMVKDINAGSASSSPAGLRVIGSTLYFTATTAANGLELWKTDGTSAGTVLVVDIVAGISSSSPANLTVVGTNLFFAATNGLAVNGTELWMTNGTTTAMVKDIAPGTTSSSPSSLINVNGTLFFAAITAANGQELWKSDGTNAGTVLVTDINAGATSSGVGSLTDAGGGVFYFIATTTAAGRELWKSDGTAGGTVQVLDLYGGAASSTPTNLTSAGSLLFFTATTPTLGLSELFVIDTAPQEEIQVEQPLATILTDGSSTIDFGTAGLGGDPISKTLYVKNVGPQTLTITGVLVDGADSSRFSLPAIVGQTVSAGGTFPIPVTLLTTSLGVKTAAIHIENTDGDENPFDINLVGTVVLAPEIAVQQPAGTLRADGGSSVSFGDSVLGVAVTRTFTLVNSGSSALNISALTFDGAASADYAAAAVPASVAAGAAATFDVTFSPSASGARTATMHVLSNDADEGSYDIRVTGIGSAPPGALRLARDINATGTGQTTSTTALFGGSAYFAGTTQQQGVELWKTDGTMAGTVLVKDIAIGPNSSSPSNFLVIGGTLYFSASNTTNGVELWKTDGTDAGTVMVKDINVGSANSSPTSLTNFGGTLFFSATDTLTNGAELWKSDGTSAGTVLVSNINTAAGSGSSPTLLTVVGLQLFFRATDTSTGTELWKTDGTTAGTVLVKDINAGTLSSTPSGLFAFGSTLLFSAADTTTGTELWVSDGTSTGTFMVSDINAGSSSSLPAGFTLVDGVVYFSASNGSTLNGTELWRTNGSPFGTTMVKDIQSGISSGSPSNITPFTSSSGFSGFLFTASNGLTAGLNGSELWRSDGTTAGTVMVKDIEPGPNGSFPQNFRVIGSTAYFMASPGTGGSATAFELWRTDGTADNTVRVLDINPGATVGSTPTALTDVGGKLVFFANDGVNGAELWSSDGTGGGTSLLVDMAPGSASSSPSLLTLANGVLLFNANDGATGVELWKVQGAGGAVSQVKDILPGTASSFPASLTRVGSTVFFTASASGFGTELWKTDGTDAGTVMVKDIFAGTTSSVPAALVAVGGTLYFSASDSAANGAELWKSDGTTAGTVMVKNINISANSGSSINNTVEFGGMLFFAAADGVTGGELWKSDGTDAGTVMVADINSGVLSSGPANFRVIGSTLFFTATTAANGTELWKTDGTAGGTMMLLDINAGVNSSSPANLTVVGSTLYFSATTTANGIELWKTDGTTAGTVLVKDILPGTGNSLLANFTAYNGQLFFSASENVNGSELWRSDGTTAGTVMVKDINSGIGSSSPFAFTNAYGTLYFRAGTAAAGFELWKTDGTTVGTVFVADIFPGTFSSSVANITLFDNWLYFTATGLDLGSELWTYDLGLPEIAIEQPSGTVLVDGASTISFGDASSVNIASVTFTLKNVGTAELTGINASVIGANAADFSVTTLPATLAAAGSTTFTVSLSPSALGARTGLLRIASNDNDENPFDIALQGNGVEALVAPVFLGTGGGTGSGTGSGVVNAPNSNGTGSLGRWESLRAGAVLSSNGRIAFRGFMEISSGSPPVTTNDFQGIWKHDGTDTRLKARSGTTAPDSSGAFFDMLPLNPSISPDGLISFYGTLRLATGSPQVTASTNQGLWSEIGGGNVRLLLRRGDTVVGGKTFRSGFAVSTSSVNTAALNTKLSTGSAMLHLDVNTPSVLLTVVAEEGQSAPGGGTWVALDGNSSDPRLSANGDLGFIGWEQVGGSFIQGIYSRVRTTAVGTAGVSVQARMGGTATGTSGATFSAFERPTVFDGGMAFRGFLNRDGDNAAGTRSQGVWSGAFGGLLPVVRTGDTSTQLATIPLGSAVTSVWSPFSNASGSITMRVGLTNGVSETRAILGNTGGTMRVIAKAGDPAPGLAGETFTNFDHPVIGDGDQVAFTASTNTGNYGIWKQATGGGALSLVMKVGDSINTGTGNKVIADITVPGATSDDRKFEARCMDALGRMLIHVTFADGSTSLVLGL